MRNTNSRDKYSKQIPSDAPQNRMTKTSGSTRSTKMEQTAYDRPASGKKIQSSKNLPSKVVKKEYVVEENMTDSRINQAKQGLQLLKKKMSSRGMSREKVSSVHKKTDEKPLMKTNSYQNQNSNLPNTRVGKKTSQIEELPKKNTPKIPMKKTVSGQSQPQPRFEEKNQSEYHNVQEQIPIKQKKDFNALLEEELRKQQQNNKPQFTPSYQNYGEEDNIQLVQCREGCGRMFSTQAIQKHEKVCQKVFQTKRKAFDSASHRAPEVQGFNKPPQISKKTNPTAVKKTVKQETKGGMPKWKAQSLAFRASMKAANGKGLSEEQKKAQDSSLVPCKFCGRKFNETAATRHIPFCQKKSKQLPVKRR